MNFLVLIHFLLKMKMSILLEAQHILQFIKYVKKNLENVLLIMIRMPKSLDKFKIN